MTAPATQDPKKHEGSDSHWRKKRTPRAVSESSRGAYRRMRNASLIIIVPVVVLAVLRFGSTGLTADTPFHMSSNSTRVSLDEVLEASPIEKGRESLPPGFENEVLSVEEFSEIRVSEQGSVIGLLSSDAPNLVFDRSAECLTQRGWVQVESGQDNTGSFVRTSDTYTWLLMSCVDVGGTTSTVIQVG